MLKGNGYTEKENAQIAQFVKDHKADPRSWQQRVIDNAPVADRKAIEEYLK